MPRFVPPRPVLLCLILALAACDAADPPAATNAAAANPYADRIAALTPGQRNGVLIRAIRDADRQCQQVTASTAAGLVEGKPAWTATCDDRTPFLVAFGPDGIATVVSVPEKP